MALCGACVANSDTEFTSTGKLRGSELPTWFTEAQKLAEQRKAGAPGDTSANAVTPAGDQASNAGLASSISAALVAAGLSTTQAQCIAGLVSSNPSLAGDLSKVVQGISGANLSAEQATTAAIGAAASLSPDRTAQIALSLAPCLDGAALAALIGAAGTSGATSAQGLIGLLSSATGLGASALKSANPNDIAALLRTVGTALPPDQLSALLAAAASVLGGGVSSGLAGIDLSKLNLSSLSAEQIGLLLALLVQLLPPGALGQLGQLGNINLSGLKLDLDPTAVQAGQLGALLLLLTPALGQALKPIDLGPPPGGNAGQIYVPPGTDLSNLNPLIFLNTQDLLNATRLEHIPDSVTLCALQTLRSVSTVAIGKLFTDSPENLGTIGSVVATLLSCLGA